MNDSKKRLFLIVLVGVAAIAAALLLYEPSAPTPASAPVPALPPAAALPAGKPGASVNTTTPVMPQGTSTVGQATRDIFAPPAEYAALLAASGNNPPNGTSPTKGGQSFGAGPLPKLTGVIAGEGTRVAILRQGTISRSYRIGESAGSYRVASIGGNSVTLEGPAGTKVLTMGQ